MSDVADRTDAAARIRAGSLTSQVARARMPRAHRRARGCRACVAIPRSGGCTASRRRRRPRPGARPAAWRADRGEGHHRHRRHADRAWLRSLCRPPPVVGRGMRRGLQARRAVVLGKTVTTEFAFSAPVRTRNPRNTDATPGGSSSGSAAAVADGMVPVAFGSQTLSSVIRPAAYCGVVGYKGTHGAYSLSGIRPFAESFDSLGLVARSVEDIALLRRVLLDEPDAPGIRRARRHRASACAARRTGTSSRPTCRCLRACGGARLQPPARGRRRHRTRRVRRARRRAAHDHGLRGRAQLRLRARAHAAATSARTSANCARPATRSRASQLGRACRDGGWASRACRRRWRRHDAWIAPATRTEAPPARDGMGDPLMSRMWTALQIPSLTRARRTRRGQACRSACSSSCPHTPTTRCSPSPRGPRPASGCTVTNGGRHPHRHLEALRRHRRGAAARPRGARRRVPDAARSVGVRQDHDAAHDRGLRRRPPPAASRWAATTSRACPRRSGTWGWSSRTIRSFRTSPSPTTSPSRWWSGAWRRRTRDDARQGAAGADPAAAHRRLAIRPSSPAASSSGSHWRARSPTRRACC